MEATNGLILLMLAMSTLDPGRFEQDGVRIDVTIQSHVYTWEVTNLAASPVMSFQVQQFNMDNAYTPSGWQSQMDAGTFRSWTDDPDRAIRPGMTKRFTAQVTSDGAALGLVPAALELADGTVVRLPEIWGPVSQPGYVKPLVAGLIIAIGLFHSSIVSWRHRRAAVRTGGHA